MEKQHNILGRVLVASVETQQGCIWVLQLHFFSFSVRMTGDLSKAAQSLNSSDFAKLDTICRQLLISYLLSCIQRLVDFDNSAWPSHYSCYHIQSRTTGDAVSNFDILACLVCCYRSLFRLVWYRHQILCPGHPACAMAWPLARTLSSVGFKAPNHTQQSPTMCNVQACSQELHPLY